MDDTLGDTIVDLLGDQKAESSICPSEVARRIRPAQPEESKGAEGWRDLMAPIRAVAFGLARDGVVKITQGDATVDPNHDPEELSGPIRIRRGPNWS
ncbi:DUF3253 domain-containing protein [Corynebacterium aquatimens]|nr:DUF3253 domain-containing protein [Corynebacterium aquatimens]